MRKREYAFAGIIVLIIVILFPVTTMILTTSINTTLPVIGNIYKFFAGIENSSDWIGFWGSYFGGVSGGIIAIAVFYWTIKNSEKTRKEDQRLQIIPVLDYDMINVSCKKYKLDIETKKLLKKMEDYSFELDIELKIQNIGLGAAQKVILESCKYGQIIDIGEDAIGTIPDKSEKIIHRKEIVYDNYDYELGWSKTLTWKFSFVDMFGNLYEQEFDTEIWYLFQAEENEDDKWLCSIKNQNPAKFNWLKSHQRMAHTER